jgi:FkbM family methyltransferase
MLRPGDVFYDIGANVGFFSLIAGRIVGESGSVCAFEPHPQNASAVRENVGLNGFKNVRLSEIAIGRGSRSDELLMTAWDGGGTLATSVAQPAALVGRTAVQVWSLDDYIEAEQLPRPTFVKIDVEGAEMEVIEGMSKTIARDKPILIYEVDDGDEEAFQRRWAELDAAVSKFGYEVLHLEDGYPALNWHVGHSLAIPCLPDGSQANQTGLRAAVRTANAHSS